MPAVMNTAGIFYVIEKFSNDIKCFMKNLLCAGNGAAKMTRRSQYHIPVINTITGLELANKGEKMYNTTKEYARILKKLLNLKKHGKGIRGSTRSIVGEGAAKGKR